MMTRRSWTWNFFFGLLKVILHHYQFSANLVVKVNYKFSYGYMVQFQHSQHCTSFTHEFFISLSFDAFTIYNNGCEFCKLVSIEIDYLFFKFKIFAFKSRWNTISELKILIHANDSMLYKDRKISSSTKSYIKRDTKYRMR